jgi:nucleotidyltransferase substrate binding protein (TIGR01987 family)
LAQEIRWKYRFRNFARAYSLLREALDSQIEELNQLEREGVIQRFEYTFELSWNTLKDRLEYDGVVMQSFTPRNVIRTAVATGLVVDGQTWINMLEDRRNTSHRYDVGLLESVLSNIQNNYLPILEALHRRLSEEMPE